MRSSWPADRILRLLAVASVEAAWLTLLYVAIQWLATTGRLDLGIGQFGLAAILGALLARRLGNRSPTAYLGGVLAATAVAGVIGVWLAVAPSLSGPDLAAALRANPGGWLLGVALLRGTTHADLHGDTGGAERQLDAGLIWIAVFWALASVSGLTGVEPFSATAYAATLTLVSAGLISLGLARLVELRVEGIDRAARWRWLLLVVAVSGVVLLIGIPLAAVLGVPVATALVGIAGPLAPVVLAIVSVIAILLGLVAELLHLLLPPSAGVPFPDLGPLVGPGSGQPGSDQGGYMTTSWADWMLVPLLIGLVWLGVVGIALLVRRPTVDDDVHLEVEIREPEPIGGALISRLPRPRLRWRRPQGTTPRTGIDAYPQALPLLVGRFEERRAGETPRQHARRIAPTALGRTVARLAIDYQLTAFAHRMLTPAEERRALERWRQVERASRVAPSRSAEPERRTGTEAPDRTT